MKNYILYKAIKKSVFELGEGKWNTIFKESVLVDTYFVRNRFLLLENPNFLEETEPSQKVFYEYVFKKIAPYSKKELNVGYFLALCDFIIEWANGDKIELWEKNTFVKNIEAFNVNLSELSMVQLNNGLPLTNSSYDNIYNKDEEFSILKEKIRRIHKIIELDELPSCCKAKVKSHIKG